MTNSPYKYLHYNIEHNIGVLTLDREDKFNALNRDVLTELKSFLTSFKVNEVSGLIFTGQGEKAFIAGADIAEMIDLNSEQATEFAKLGVEVSNLFESLPIPVVAAVNGFALGGGLEMALGCDFIMATRNAVFGLPEVSLGLIPGFGGTQRLPRIIGRNRAKEWIFSGRKIKIEEAVTSGLVVADFATKEDLIYGAIDFLQKTAFNSKHAIACAKDIINKGIELELPAALNIETTAFGAIFGTPDMQEGTQAFIEKRKPSFNKD